MESYLINLISSLGLALPLAILVAFRAGRLRGLTTENLEERLSDLVFDSLKEQISNQLENLLRIQFGQSFRLPRGLTLQQVACHLHQDMESVDVLQAIYWDLVNKGLQSHYFVQALQYIMTFLS
jgi:hypothetical protein